jgi:hypothetical protein
MGPRQLLWCTPTPHPSHDSIVWNAVGVIVRGHNGFSDCLLVPVLQFKEGLERFAR